jgi:hypothetical protein
MAKLLSLPQFRVLGGSSEARRQQVDWRKIHACSAGLMPGIAADCVSLSKEKGRQVAPFKFASLWRCRKDTHRDAYAE